MAASVHSRFTVALGPIPKAYIYIDAHAATSLADVPTILAGPFAVNAQEVSFVVDGTSNDTMTKTAANDGLGVLAAFSGTDITKKLIDVTQMSNNKFYQLEVTGF